MTVGRGRSTQREPTLAQGNSASHYTTVLPYITHVMFSLCFIFYLFLIFRLQVEE